VCELKVSTGRHERAVFQPLGRCERPRIDATEVATFSVAAASVYSLRMKRRLIFLERLLGGRRPPTGPLTTQEAADAEESQQKKLSNEEAAGGHEQKDAGDREP
jgi:hypothetical protein